MCGILGLISNKREERLLSEAGELQAHRGPDARDEFIAQGTQHFVHLAHQRLAIIDLDPAASQPFSDASGRWTLSYNGEIYNYLELAKELQALGASFKTKSDTEVLLQALIHWGLDKTLDKLNGMFAFIFYDKHEQRLWVARDRFGIKPLYYATSDDRLALASEIKGCLKLWNEKVTVNSGVVADYLRQNLLETDREETFFNGVLKVEPGFYLEIDLRHEKIRLEKKRYYQLLIKQSAPKDFNECREEYRRLLSDSVRLRMRSDVPVGILLSGGIDSSVVASLSHKYSQSSGAPPPRLLSVVSDDKRNDESEFINAMADYLNQEAQKIFLDLNPDRFFDTMEKAHWHNDEPLTSFSAIGHFEMMRQSAKTDSVVLLSGQGADEGLGGYKKYVAFGIQSLLRQGRIPQAMALASGFLMNGSILNDYTFKDAKRYLPSWMRPKKTSVMSESLKSFPSKPIGLNGLSFAGRSIKDIEHYSVPILLHLEDRLSMAFSREIRVPFLDHRLVEFTVDLPMHLKLSSGWTKKILRDSFEDSLPSKIAWRKDKKGFTLPQDLWLKGPLAPKLTEMFAGDAMMYDLDLVDKTAMIDLFERFKSHSEHWQVSYKDIFSPMSVELWLQQFNEYLK